MTKYKIIIRNLKKMANNEFSEEFHSRKIMLLFYDNVEKNAAKKGLQRKIDYSIKCFFNLPNSIVWIRFKPEDFEYCRRCGRKLTKPESTLLKYGETCWEKILEANEIGI